MSSLTYPTHMPMLRKSRKNVDKSDFFAPLAAFSEQTSVHGVRFFSSSKTNSCMRIAFFIAFLPCAIYCVIICKSTTLNFLKFEPKTKLSYELFEKIPVPAVTLCNLNPIKVRNGLLQCTFLCK